MSHIAHSHDVTNQPQALEGFNAFDSDKVLQYWLQRFGGEWAVPALSAYGHQVGHALQQAGFQANRQEPEFHSHNRFGQRVDMVEYHPAYHQLMQAAIEAGHHSLPWATSESGAHVARAALAYLHTQADPGTGCPLTMTFAAVPAIRHQSDIADIWLPRILANQYDSRNVPFFEKQGVTIGMAMTEKQGGSDVRANTTKAIPIGSGGAGQLYEITGHKWFCSAPMCDAFLVLAQAPGGLSCFLLPRWRADGQKNAMHIQRLKKKVGNRSNASSEVEFFGAQAWLIGEEGRGVRTIIDMVAMTRFDCMTGSAALMGQAAREAIFHSSGRAAFGKPLHAHPLMQNVLADLALEAEAALALAMLTAHALDKINDPLQAGLVRAGTAIGKYWICKRAVLQTFEAMECVGGVGYVEDSVLARLYKEAPVNSIWEGSGNIQCLDLLRAMQKEPQTLQALMLELEKAGGRFAAFDDLLQQTQQQLTNTDEYQARRTMESLARLWQAATLIQYGEPMVADAFVKARIEQPGVQFGTLPVGIDCQAIIARHLPA
ncbi:acyl-CoA dehydrogenase family protein [Aliiglaciecola sp. CAU 1673]|uniref:acyl-CoA dehydrogenase family protein n=1 Tax=Aliiglaciecola sp. CAU 1673 TaxID=3032595 RepID=UPI0023DB3279|nr:acyl-CoA dehydrogenase family protein [Aliiglaciecola sp. CAU 1673]MDF2180112.1 acyl-CoA dehydrogenase family protein [Aliiglaciecola sp. CAU 1673]